MKGVIELGNTSVRTLLCISGNIIIVYMASFDIRWEGRGSYALAVGHRKQEIFTKTWVSTSLFCRFS